MKKKGQKDVEPKQRILETAIRLFAKKGYAATGMRELAKEADVNLAMINYYYGSKRKILEELIDTYFKTYIEIIDGAFSTDTPPEEKVRRALRDMIRFFRENPDLVIVALTEFPYDLPEIADFKASYVSRLDDILIRKLWPSLEGVVNVPLRLEILGPAIASMCASHFFFRPTIEKLRSEPFDEAFYEDYTKLITEFVMYGLFGKVASYPDGDDKEEIDNDV